MQVTYIALIYTTKWVDSWYYSVIDSQRKRVNCGHLSLNVVGYLSTNLDSEGSLSCDHCCPSSMQNKLLTDPQSIYVPRASLEKSVNRLTLCFLCSLWTKVLLKHMLCMSDVELDKPVQQAENSVGNICHSGQFGDLSVRRMPRATNLWSLVINLLQYKQLEREVVRYAFLCLLCLILFHWCIIPFQTELVNCASPFQQYDDSYCILHQSFLPFSRMGTIATVYLKTNSHIYRKVFA